ncbi:MULTISPECIES: peptidase M50 [unclassified Campylobacter]|uniref:peptidase M50 n=1 Tax=unclassified Campylobacter TaxID=2593542 RepID=UPI003D3333B8
MLLNTFAPPFRLVGGYFIAGILFLLLSIFAFFKADFDMLTAFNTAGFIHIFLVGFVMSVIIGALYQLTSVILESPFFSIKGAFINLFIFCAGTILLSFGMIGAKIMFLHAGGALLFISLCFFGLTYFLSFFISKKRSFAQTALLISSVYLLVGIVLGFLLVMVFAGVVSLNFEILLRLHVYFVSGFVFFIIVGVASVLLPMFALSHDVSFLASKISLCLFVLAGVLLCFKFEISLLLIALSFFAFIFQAGLIIKKRVRKAWDYWNLNVILSLVSLVVAFVFVYFDRTNFAVWLLIYGFLYPFIVGHLYKIAPFLIWYHYISPFVGKTKVPLLDNMILKKPAYVALCFNILALIAYAFSANLAVLFLTISVILVALNMLNFFKYTKFGAEK